MEKQDMLKKIERNLNKKKISFGFNKSFKRNFNKSKTI